jgi:hypothetical protein
MNQMQDRSEKLFHQQDLVVWHAQSERHPLPIPGVVVRWEEHNVIIRARVDGNVKEIAVSPDELAER